MTLARKLNTYLAIVLLTVIFMTLLQKVSLPYILTGNIALCVYVGQFDIQVSPVGQIFSLQLCML